MFPWAQYLIETYLSIFVAIMNQFVNSIYLPHVHANIPLETVREVLETKFQIGTIGHMESIPKVNKKDGHLYYSCFVYFETWSNSPSANYLSKQFATSTYPCIRRIW